MLHWYSACHPYIAAVGVIFTQWTLEDGTTRIGAKLFNSDGCHLGGNRWGWTEAILVPKETFQCSLKKIVALNPGGKLAKGYL